MDIQQLRYFSRVYELENYAKAANRLYISRQALRKSIQRLEREVGAPLFESTGNKLKATESADMLYRESREVLESFARLESIIEQKRFERGESLIRLAQSRGSTDVFSRRFIEMAQAASFDSTSIMHHVNCIQCSCAEVREMVLDGRAAVGQFIATSVDEDLFDCEVAFEGRICIAVRDDDPLAEKDEIDIRDLDGRRFTTQGPGFDVHDALARLAQDAGFVLTLGNIVDNLAMAMRYVESGLGLTYAYDSGAIHPRNAPHVVCRPLSDPDARWMYCAIARKGTADPRLLTFFTGKEEQSKILASGLFKSRQL